MSTSDTTSYSTFVVGRSHCYALIEDITSTYVDEVGIPVGKVCSSRLYDHSFIRKKKLVNKVN